MPSRRGGGACFGKPWLSYDDLMRMQRSNNALSRSPERAEGERSAYSLNGIGSGRMGRSSVYSASTGSGSDKS